MRTVLTFIILISLAVYVSAERQHRLTKASIPSCSL